MKMSENSMQMVGEVSNVVVNSESSQELKKEQEVAATKKCPKCGRVLPTTEFYGNTRSKDGLQDKCKECQKEWNAEYQRRKRKEKVNVDACDTTIKISEQERTMTKVFTNPELAKFTPRELMSELKARGWVWDSMLEPQKRVYFSKI
jgi:transposase-like protein